MARVRGHEAQPEQGLLLSRRLCCRAEAGRGRRNRRALQALARGQGPEGGPGQVQGLAGAELPGDGQDEVLGPPLAPPAGLQVVDGEGGDRFRECPGRRSPGGGRRTWCSGRGRPSRPRDRSAGERVPGGRSAAGAPGPLRPSRGRPRDRPGGRSPCPLRGPASGRRNRSIRPPCPRARVPPTRAASRCRAVSEGRRRVPWNIRREVRVVIPRAGPSSREPARAIRCRATNSAVGRSSRSTIRPLARVSRSTMGHRGSPWLTVGYCRTCTRVKASGSRYVRATRCTSAGVTGATRARYSSNESMVPLTSTMARVA